MARKFPEKKTRSTDRGGTVRRANESRGRPAPARSAPSRVSSPLRERMAALRGGGGGAAPQRDPRQGAIDFGRQMTGGGGGTQQAVDAIRNRVMQQLSGRGIYQDDRGSYQISGMERNDPSLAIRDMAVRGMGGPSWEQVVADADARLRQPGGTSGLPGGMNVPNGATMADAIIRGMPTPGSVNQRPVWEQTTPAGGQPGTLGGLVAGPQPGLSAPPMTPRGVPGGPTVPPIQSMPPRGTPAAPAGSLGGLVAGPQPGLSAPPMAPVSGGFPPQGQGVGRTTTPTGAQVDPSTYPVTNGTFSAQEQSVLNRAFTPATGPVPVPPGGWNWERMTPATGGVQGGMPGNAPGGGMAPPPSTLYAKDYSDISAPGTLRGLAAGPQPGLSAAPPPQANTYVGPPGSAQSRQNFQAPSAPQQGVIPIPPPIPPRTTPVSSGADVGMMGSVLGSMEMSRQEQPLHGLFGGTGQTPAQTGATVSQGVPISVSPLEGMPGNMPGGGIPQPRPAASEQGLTYQPYSQRAYAPPGGPPISPVMGGPTSLDRSQAQQGNIGAGTGGQVIGSGIGQQGNIPGTPTGAVPNPNYNPPTSFPSQGQGVGRTSVPTAPGGGTTPVVPPGALPGNTTPSRPGQMPSVFPNGGPFGSPGPTPIPGFPSAGMPGGKDLSQLGAQIQQTVASRTAGIRGQAQAPVSSPANTAMAGLAGLGDRIRQSVMSAQGGTPGIPGVGTTRGVTAGPDLGGLGSSIMERVRSQMTQAGVGQGLPGMPTMPVPGQPTGGPTVPPVTTPGSPTAAPAPAPAGSIGAPQGAVPGGLQIAFGRGGSWDAVNQYDASFVSAGQKYGVDPAMLKAMAVIESGGQMIPNQGGSGAYGIMQIKESDWGWLANQIGADLSTPDGQIQTAAAILGQYGTGSTPEERFINSYYPTGCMDCQGEDGATPNQYLSDMHILMGAINAANTGTGTATQPTGGPTTGAPTTGAQPTGGPTTGAPNINTQYSGSVSAATSPMDSASFKPQFIVYHSTEGDSFNGAATFDKDGNGTVDGSTNYVIDKDGTIYEMVSPGSAMPWANGQGDGAGLNPDKVALSQAAQQDNLNNMTISIEVVGRQGERATPQQIAAGQQLTAYLSNTYQIPLDDQHMVSHADIAADRSDPGTLYQPMDMMPQGGATTQAAPNGQTAPAPTGGGGVMVTLQPGLRPVLDRRSPSDPNYGLNVDGTPGTPASGTPVTQPAPVTQSTLDTTVTKTGVPTKVSAAIGDPQGAQIADLADNYVGSPYVHGGIEPSGWDCSGFVYWLAQNTGHTDVPQGSHEQYNWAQQSGRLNTDPSQLQPGDIIFWNTGYGCRSGNCVSHVSIYLGNGQMIGANNPNDGTHIDTVEEWMAIYPYMGSARMY